MKIKLRRQGLPLHFEAVNEAGKTMHMDAKEAVGGSGQGMGPMEGLISALGGCSSIDIVLFLQKLRQTLEDIHVEIDAERDPDQVPSLFTKIHAHYDLYGSLDPKQVEKAISLSIDKYCSVAQILKKTAPITTSFTIHSTR
ncbi:MAG: OsmC family protein [Saprospiraceae bacterium]|nr:OsmC family protein [Saprospiraceae bacterium]MBK7437923.1 OsmC family protein [Saprospiraceae bacterium]MBK8512028.1 OsmC family protein [Saprospiraceae bacterium]MBL0111974.1 OsmC family protein [Saprospiraceae bacterium]MBP8944162.1 OsmC family protein [Saprospiraceae bacterium]